MTIIVIIGPCTSCKLLENSNRLHEAMAEISSWLLVRNAISAFRNSLEIQYVRRLPSSFLKKCKRYHEGSPTNISDVVIHKDASLSNSDISPPTKEKPTATLQSRQAMKNLACVSWPQRKAETLPVLAQDCPKFGTTTRGRAAGKIFDKIFSLGQPTPRRADRDCLKMHATSFALRLVFSVLDVHLVHGCTN